MTTALSIEAMPFTQRRELLLTAVGERDTAGVDSVLRAFSDMVAEAVSARDVGAIAGLRGQAGRLIRRLSSEFGDGREAEALVWLKALDIVLDRGRTGALAHAAAEERERSASVLRDRIVSLLDEGPLRPRDLAERLECDPSQVSRAMRELLSDHRVHRVDAPPNSSDRRAHWYGARTDAARAAA